MTTQLQLLIIIIIIIIIVVVVVVVVVLFYVLFVCKCTLYYCHRVSTRWPTQWQVTNISNINFDLCSMCGYLICRPSLHRKHSDPVSITFRWLPFVRCPVCNKHRVKFMHRYNQVKQKKFLSCRTKLTHLHATQSHFSPMHF